MKSLVYYMHDEAAAFRFRLTGDLSHDAAQDLEQARQTASSIFGGRSLIVDLTGVITIDTAGRALLEKWHELGAQLVVTAWEAKARLQSITSVPITLRATNSRGLRWLPSWFTRL